MTKLRILTVLILLSTVLPGFVSAQDDGIEVFLNPKKFYRKFFPNLKIKKPNIDSSYVKSYPNYLTVGAHLLLPATDLDIHSLSSTTQASDASSLFRTNINNILAFSASYRFIGAGFALAVSGKKDNPNLASTAYRTATIKYNSAAYYLQFKFMRTKGFTDVNENNATGTAPFTKRDDLVIREYQFEGMYNLGWKKYSYYAPIDYTQRQLKSHFGILLKAGAYYNQLAVDSNLLTVKQRPFFDDFEDIRKIRTTSFKVAPGAGANLVFYRRLYLSAAVFTPYNLYFYKYFTTDDQLTQKGASIAIVLDASISLGYQSERLYAGIRYQADNKQVELNTVKINTLFSYFGFDLGYRFKAPRFVKKVYKDTMPPGM